MSTGAMTADPARRGSWTDQIRSEWAKARTVRTTAALIATALAVELTLRAVSIQVLPDAADAATIVSALKPSITFPVLVAAGPLLLATTEWRHGFATLTYTWSPRRHTVLGAKAVVSAGLGAASAALLSGPALGLQLALLTAQHQPRPAPSTLVAIGAGPVVSGALLGVLGAALGTIVRDQVSALTVAVAVLFVLPLPALLLSPGLYAVTPSGLADALAGQGTALPQLLPPAAALALLTALVAAATGAALAVLRRRDLS